MSTPLKRLAKFWIKVPKLANNVRKMGSSVNKDFLSHPYTPTDIMTILVYRSII